MTEEHIIPKSIGGKLSAWIYCKDCNDEFGDGIDAELDKNLLYYSLNLKVNKNKYKNQSYDCQYKDIKLTYNGRELKRKHPIINIKKDGGKFESIEIIARSNNELNKITLGFKKKHSLPHDFENKTETIPGPIELERIFVFDNSLIRRAVSKIAYNLICIKIPDQYVFSPSFDEIRSYIRFGAEKDMASANFRNTSFMIDNIRPLHKIHINFNRRNKLIIGFICLFGIFRYTILLSRDFNRVIDLADLDYTFDPTTGREICTKPNFISPEIGIEDALRPKHSKELVLGELRKGHKMLENYIEGFEAIEIEHTA